ncbi:MAG: tetratricopeptide repeat protein [Polyangiaceae bacterium]|nr:tetratricopeptide repeat protein [Polyangiaceae bacterium]
MKARKASQDLLERALRLQRSGRTKEAESLCRQLICRSGLNHRALCSLGLLLFDSGRLAESTQYLERAVAIEPNPKYLTSLGEVYRRQGRLDVAAETFGRILEIDPDFPEARLNLAVTLAEAGVDAEALALLEEAARVGPDSPRLRVALAWLLLHLHRPEPSLAHARRAVELGPNVASTHWQLGDALDACGKKAEAISSYRRAVEVNPSDHRAHSDLIVAMLLDPEYDAQAIGAEARAWAQRHAEPLRKQLRPHANDKDPERRLRVGYVSPDFRAHPIQQFLVPLLEHHDPSAFEIFLYSSVHRPDPETEWYRAFAGDRFRDIRNIEDLQAAELVRSDRIDILVDLALHSTGGRLRVFACRPAPVQISWLGYAGTTGLGTIDYRITDPFVDPPGADVSVYSEACLHLPETSWCYAALCSEPAVEALPALSAGCVTFGCQNSYRKLHTRLFALWARVLREVAGARLFLHAEEHARKGVRQAFAREGVQADRLEFGGRLSRDEYLRRYQRIDIGLDTFPFNGATTTLDAAWMGVPVVTLSGRSSLQRAGTCIAMNLGLPELVALSEDEFVETAVTLARDLDHLSQLRAGLRCRLETSPLGNAPRFARHIENAYRTAWRRYCTGP